MKDKHKQAFEEFASRIKEKFSTVERVILFGSVARGDYGVNSDVDVMIVVEDLSERESIEDLAYRMTSEYGVSITPVIVKEDEREKDLVRTAEKEGVPYVGSG